MRYYTRRTSLAAALRDLEHPKLAVRQRAAEALGRVPPAERQEAAAALRRLLADDPELRFHAALSLGELGDEASVEPLSGLVEQGDDDARQAAVIALGKIGAPAAAPALEAAARDPSADVRFQLPAALIQVASERAAPILKDLLADDDAEVRSSAAAALGDLGDPLAADPLVRTLKDPEAAVRIESALALARLRDPRGSRVLIEALGDRSRQQLVASHLFRTPVPEARAALRGRLSAMFGDPVARVWIAGALVKLDDPEGERRLRTFLASSRDEVRGLTIEVLGQLSQTWARRLLQELLETKEGERWREELEDALKPPI